MKTTLPLVGAALAVLSVTKLSAKPVGKIDYAVVSLGTWIATGDNSGAVTKDSYFQSAKVSAWYHVGKLKGSISLPLALTFEKYSDEIRYALYAGDGEVTFGVGAGPVTPRLGFSFPMGYPPRGTAWIGSGNLRMLAGAYFKLGSIRNGTIDFGGDAVFRVAVSDTSDGARLGRGSISGYLSLKATQTSAKWKRSGSLFVSGSRFTYTDWGGKERSISVLPMLSVGRKFGSSSELSVFAGAGPGWSGETWGEPRLNVSAGVSLGTGL